jgi:hypothetical protein
MKTTQRGHLVIVPTNTPAGTLQDLRKAGYIPILSDDPDKIRLVVPSSAILSGDLLMSAMHGVVTSGSSIPMERFAKELLRRMVERESKTP